MKRVIKISGSIQTELTEDELTDAFIAFIESKSSVFYGKIQEEKGGEQVGDDMRHVDYDER